MNPCWEINFIIYEWRKHLSKVLVNQKKTNFQAWFSSLVLDSQFKTRQIAPWITYFSVLIIGDPREVAQL